MDLEGIKTFGIFTKSIHVEKLVNYLNTKTDLDYVISTDKRELYNWYKYDVGISYGFGSIIDLNRVPAKIFYNYHPAPLPEYKGGDVYARAVKEMVAGWGVTLHVMTDVLDTGKIIDEIRFKLMSSPSSTNEIGSIAHYYLFQLFKKTIKDLEIKGCEKI